MATATTHLLDTRKPDRTVLLLACVAAFSFLTGTLIVLGEQSALSPAGNPDLQYAMLVAMFPLVLSLIALPLALVLCLFRRTRKGGLTLGTACLIFAATIFVAAQAAKAVRIDAFMSFTWRAQPLIEAIDEYETMNGMPPATLEELVPRYISEIPKTDMVAYPEIRYRVCEEGGCSDNPWMLEVGGSRFPFDFHRLFYYPKQNYNERGGDPRTKIGDWAYIND